MATTVASLLIASTIETLDNGASSAQLNDGTTLIDQWLAVVKQNHSGDHIVSELQTLHDQLGEDRPNARKIAQLVKKLGAETAKAARNADRQYQLALKDLGESLKEFANELK